MNPPGLSHPLQRGKTSNNALHETRDTKPQSDTAKRVVPMRERFTPSGWGFLRIAKNEKSNRNHGQRGLSLHRPSWRLSASNRRRHTAGSITRQRVGVVYGGGMRWEWSTVTDSEQNIVLEFERRVQSSSAMRSLGSLGKRSKSSPLETVMTQGIPDHTARIGLAEGETLGEQIHWLFAMPSESPEVQRFESMQRQFHGEAAHGEAA